MIGEKEMNDMIRTMVERRSCRAYKNEQISDAELDDILTAGEWAPTGMGAQSPMLVALQNPEVIAKISKLNAEVMGHNMDPFYGAPTVVVVFADRSRVTYMEDGALAMGNMMNAAHSLGVASCWVHRATQVFDTQEGKGLMKEWGVPEGYVGIANCILGYAAAPLAEGKVRKENYIIKVK
ncbi:MAG: Nitroreductase [Firmicutes bacterium]|nr:Nitroreductase [Bacillota bacterium]